MRSETRPARAGGAIAIQFALLAFAFFAIAAVVIDVRLASLAQQQMQAAADVAALEGLRQKGISPGTSQRTVASDTVRRFFDDDLRPANGDPMQYGAGPLVTLTGGHAGSNGSAQLTASGVYDPVLELNAANAPWGDIVLGSHDAADTAHLEDADYTRSDFAPTSDAAASAVLVRVRRTANATGLDRIAGVSSSGPPLPFLFGLASTMHAAPGSAYDPRTRGLSVQAASIAATRRAIEVSGPGPSYGFPTLQVFVLFSPGPGLPPGQPFPPPGQFGTTPANGAPPPGLTFTRPRGPLGPLYGIWDDLVVGQSFQVDVDSDGFLHLVGSGGGGATHVVGYFGRELGTQDGPLTRVGQIADLLLGSFPFSGATFVPVVRSINGTVRVIGFGFVSVSVGVTPGTGGRRLTVTKLAGGIRAGGPNAVSIRALRDLAADPALVLAHSQFTDPVTAPVLVR